MTWFADKLGPAPASIKAELKNQPQRAATAQVAAKGNKAAAPAPQQQARQAAPQQAAARPAPTPPPAPAPEPEKKKKKGWF
jgi:hypothetical protein